MSESSRRRGKVLFTAELLIESMLPEGSVIQDIKFDTNRNIIEVFIQNESLPWAIEGGDAPIVDMCFEDGRNVFSNVTE